MSAIRIVGTGPVSLALRGLLARQGFGADELACDEPPDSLPPWLAGRTLALSLGSWQLLSRIAPPPESAPILVVDVSLRGSAGRTRLSAAELRIPALGHVVRYDALHRALRDALPSGAASASLPSPSPPAVTVIADGNPGEDGRLRDFDQAAVLATVRASRPTEGVAFERFTDEGPLALLPLAGSGLWSLVWCAGSQASTQRAGLPAAGFAAELRDRFGPWLGELALCDAPQVAPL